MKVAVFWLRRDLRLEDNTALNHALESGKPVLPIFIFDANILEELPENDARVSFIHRTLESIDQKLKEQGSSLLCLKGKPEEVWKKLLEEYDIATAYTNKDYEPYASKRDSAVKKLLKKKDIDLHFFKDQVIFEESEVVKDDGKPYTVYTPYKNKWLSHFNREEIKPRTSKGDFVQQTFNFPSLKELGFTSSDIEVKPYQLNQIDDYASTRNFPARDATSYLSPHLRFGTVSVRQIIAQLKKSDATFLSELIWREFFMQILFHFPHVVDSNFKPQYNGIEWRNNEAEFDKWCKGQTGYPMVDAGMRQLNQTGYMHNRVRMVVASFLCKHLLIDWRWGEAYFAEKLLDYELASNNGNWQWSAGTGCDAAPYFRVFNPTEQIKKFDPKMEYIKKWVPELNEFDYPQPMVEHKMARERAIEAYKKGLARNN
ncbi:MAG: deoxyribodipyrimidine photo-lyase [Cyclobacteriaceae bacterium]|nr:deoxyribodipyrimidine photo-lyase [Cyclobacteriaceae bacterium]